MLFDLQQILDHPASPPSWFRLALEHNLQQIAKEGKVQRYFLKALRQIFEAETAWYVAVPVTGAKPTWDGADRPCDLELVRAFAKQQEPELPPHLLLAPVRVHGRLTAVVAIDKAEGSFPIGSGHELNGLCNSLAEELEAREERRVDEILLDIKEEILRDLRPQDLVYRILHGLRRLVDYDHSSALLIYDRTLGALRLEAEQIAWVRAKSRAIGRELPISKKLVEELRLRGERIVSRRRGVMDAAASVILEPEDELADLLAYAAEGEAPEPTSTLCAPLVERGRFLGVLRVSALRRSPFNDWDARVVSTFLPAALAAIQDAHDREAREHRALSAEQRAYLVNVARVVAHDVNNSLGAALPLAQQILADLEAGEPISPEIWREDLAAIIGEIDKCRGVFDRLLRQEQDPQTGDPSSDVNRAIKSQWSFLEPRFRRRRVTLHQDLAKTLPKVGMYRGQLEHVVHNLVVNALDVVPREGGEIHVRTYLESEPNGGDRVVLEVADNGPGIAEEEIGRVFEMFYSTKGGTGLGLPLVRRLVAEAKGQVEIAPRDDGVSVGGTVVTVRLPLATDAERVAGAVEVIR